MHVRMYVCLCMYVIMRYGSDEDGMSIKIEIEINHQSYPI